MARFDVAATDPLLYGEKAIGPAFQLGFKEAAKAEQAKIDNKKKERHLQVAEGNLKLAQHKQKLGRSDDARKSEIDKFLYTIDDNGLMDKVGMNIDEKNMALSQLGKRRQLKNAQYWNLERGFSTSDGKASVITGKDYATNTIQHLRYTKAEAAASDGAVQAGAIKYMTRKEYNKMIANPKYKNQIDNPEYSDLDVTANKYEEMSTAQLKDSARGSSDEIRKLNIERLRKAVKRYEKTGIFPDEETMVKGMPQNARVELIAQFPDPVMLWGLSSAQQRSLWKDIQRMGEDEAKRMANEDGGAEHYAWISKFIADRKSAPAIDIRSTVSQSMMDNPDETIDVFAGRKHEKSKIKGQRVAGSYQERISQARKEAADKKAALSAEFEGIMGEFSGAKAAAKQAWAVGRQDAFKASMSQGQKAFYNKANTYELMAINEAEPDQKIAEVKRLMDFRKTLNKDERIYYDNADYETLRELHQMSPVERSIELNRKTNFMRGSGGRQTIFRKLFKPFTDISEKMSEREWFEKGRYERKRRKE